MNIDSATGTIFFPGGRLSGDETLVRFQRETFAERAEITVSNSPWLTFDVQLDQRFLASVVFDGQRLAEIRLVMTEPGEEDQPWTVESERRRRLMHDAWLETQFGSSPRRFPWGTVESVYDERANCSYIVLRYS